MKPTEVLVEEHEVILKMLGVIKAISGKIEAVDQQILKDIVDFIRTFADHCHHAKEEKILYVEAEKSGVPNEEGPIGMMLIEHDEGRGYVKRMDEALRQIGTGDKKGYQQYAENALNYAALLEQHIMKENQILYPMIDMHLTPKLQKEISAKFDQLEKKELGEGVHHKFHQLVEKLEKKFAG